ncbi:MAG: hypothetical protein GY906_06090 [bacterium]|nr:hypothetical protein [bacterium]
MTARAYTDLDLKQLIALVAAHARSSVGRNFLIQAQCFPTPETTHSNVALTIQLSEFILEHEPLSFSGIDEALPLLEPGAPAAESPSDLMCLYALVRRVAAVRRSLASASPHLRMLTDCGSQLPDFDELVRWAGARLGRDGRIPDSASPELGRLRSMAARLRSEITGQLEAIKRGHADVTTDAPPTLRRDRYCLAVRAGAQGRLPGLVLDSSGSGATVFLEPFSVVELNNDLVDASARQREEIGRIVREVAAAFDSQRPDLIAAVEVLTELDAAQARVLFGRSCGGRPIAPVRNSALVLRGARHPLLDQRLRSLRAEVLGETVAREQNDVVPLEFEFPVKTRVLVVSGPNAGGKTVVLKTLGLMVIMAHMGIPLPVDEGTSIPLIDNLWCHIGDEQSVSDDLSTFSGAMTATARLLASATENSLVLYDELGAGTDPLEGAALGCAILEELGRRGALCVATTHLAAIAMSSGETAGMSNAAMEFDDEQERPTFRLRMGRPGRSRALQIASRVGIAEPILDRARDLLGGSHLELEHWLDRLEALEGELLDERTAIERERLEQTRLKKNLEQRLEEVEKRREEVDQELRDERTKLQRRAKHQLDEVLERLDQAVEKHETLGRKKRQQLRDQALALPDPKPNGSPDEGAWSLGDAAGVEGIKGQGIVEELRGDTARIAIGGKKLWVRVEQLVRAVGSVAVSTSKVRTEVAESPPRELHLRGMDSESAREELEHFLDRALSTGLSMVRVVHGHGTGVLRKMVQDVCRTHPAVRSFKHPHQRFGGTGATEVNLDVGE